MGIVNNFAADFYGCPTYFINVAVSEIAGFNVRVYHWENRGGVLAPLFVAVIPSLDLATISRDVQQTAIKSLKHGGLAGFVAAH